MKTVPHLPALDGLRAVAALGVVVTHVSFQTGTGWAWAERLDYMVAVFFALSAFVLWRRHVIPAGQHDWRAYYWARVRRVAPAYVLCVVAVLALLPGARFSVSQVLSNMFAVQIYVPDGLAQGLTHLWSLCVEFSFYAVLPLLAMLRPRMAVMVMVLSSVAWPWIAEPIREATGVNAQIWPPAFALWFAVGVIAAEGERRWAAGRRMTGTRKTDVKRGLHKAWCEFAWHVFWWVLAAVCVWVGSRSWFGPAGLVHPTPAEFSRRVIVGAACAACILVPYAWGGRSVVLQSRIMRTLGTWSYGIFLWHVPVLWVVFPLVGVPLFGGHFWVVLAMTLALTIPVAAASFYWVERPAAAIMAPTAAAAKPTASQESPA